MTALNLYNVTRDCGYAASRGMRCLIANCRINHMSKGDGNACVAPRLASLYPGR